MFAVLFGISLLAEVLSSDQPLVARYDGHWYFPVLQTLPETTFGGDFPAPAYYLDPLIRDNLAKPGNFALYPLNHYHHSTINYFAKYPTRRRPTKTTGSAPTTAAAICSRGCSTVFACRWCSRSSSP